MYSYNSFDKLLSMLLKDIFSATSHLRMYIVLIIAIPNEAKVFHDGGIGKCVTAINKRTNTVQQNSSLLQTYGFTALVILLH